MILLLIKFVSLLVTIISTAMRKMMLKVSSLIDFLENSISDIFVLVLRFSYLMKILFCSFMLCFEFDMNSRFKLLRVMLCSEPNSDYF
jgi:hypothetical protein